MDVVPWLVAGSPDCRGAFLLRTGEAGIETPRGLQGNMTIVGISESKGGSITIAGA